MKKGRHGVNALVQLLYRVVGAATPFLLTCYTGVAYAQTMAELEQRVRANEISVARQDERLVTALARIYAFDARIEAIEQRLWWLILATGGSAFVSGGVAVDRARHVYKQKRNGTDG